MTDLSLEKEMAYDKEILRICGREGINALPIDDKVAEVIIGAVDVMSIEGMPGFSIELQHAEDRLVVMLDALFPALTEKYGWKDRVNEIFRR